MSCQEESDATCWIHISGAHNSSTAMEVSTFVQNKLGIKPKECHMLLKKGLSPYSQLTLSFKIAVERRSLDYLLKHNGWPDQVYVREFSPEKKTQGFPMAAAIQRKRKISITKM